MRIGNYGMDIHDQLGLKNRLLAATKQEDTEHTLKTVRILFSSEFHAAMASLSFFA